MIDKTAGLPTQIRQLEKRLKEMDASKIKPALVKEITDTIQNLKNMLKEKMEKKEQRKKDKEQKATPEVQVEAAPAGSATSVGAVAPQSLTPAPGAPTATPTTPDDQKVSCPLCGGITFPDQSSYQQHMEFTHASDVMPTTPGQKLDKTVASVDADAAASPKCAICGIDFASFPEYQQHRDQAHSKEPAKEKVMGDQETGPSFKLDDEVKPIRGSESTGKVMRWDGKPNDLVYVSWDSGPLADRDGFGGYYPHDLALVETEAPVTATADGAPAEEEHCPCWEDKSSYCPKCKSRKTSDLRTNYDALLKDLKEERDVHYTQGNSAWVARLDQKIVDLEKSIEEKFKEDKIEPESCSACGQKKESASNKCVCGNPTNPKTKQPFSHALCDSCLQAEKDVDRMERNDAYKEGGAQNAEELTVMDHTPPRANSGPDAGGKDTHDEFQDEWAMPAGIELESKLPKQQQKELDSLVQKAVYGYQINIMDMSKIYQAGEAAFIAGQDVTAAVHTFLDSMVASGKAMKTADLKPFVTEPTKISIFKKEFLATPVNGQKKFAGYDISQDGKKLFNIGSKDSQPMTKEQLEFCAQIELTRGYKQAKLVEKIAFLEAGSRVYIIASDKSGKRVKFASMDKGVRGWAPVSKFAFVAKQGEMRKHNDHIDNTFGHNGKEILVDCPNGSGNMVWLPINALLPIEAPPATPESLNDLEGSSKQSTKPSLPPYKGDTRSCSRCGVNFLDTDNLSKCPDCMKVSKHNMEVEMERYQNDKHKPLPETVPGESYAPNFSDEIEDPMADVKPFFNPYMKRKKSAKECPDCHGTFEGAENEKCPTCGQFAVQKTALKPQLPLAIPNQRVDVNSSGCDQCAASMINGVFCHETGCPAKAKEDRIRQQNDDLYDMEMNDIESSTKKQADPKWNECASCNKVFKVDPNQKLNHSYCPDCHKIWPVLMDAWDQGTLTPEQEQQLNQMNANVSKHFNDGRSGRRPGGKEPSFPSSYRNEIEDPLEHMPDPLNENVEASLNKRATVTHREDGWHVLSEKGKNLGGPYKSKGEAVKRLRQVEYFKHASLKPFSKKADVLTDHITDMKGRMDQVQERLQQVPAIKTADTITDDTVVTNDPNAVIPNPNDPNAPPAPVIKNVQPTDNDNLEIPVPMPSSPPSPGQKWVFDTQNNVYVSMPDPAYHGAAI